jgi:hypothetical protein
MKELFIRLVVGGTVVSFFAVLGDLLKPKSFAGLLGTRLSVALATLSLTVLKDGRPTHTLHSGFGAAALR